MPLKGNGFMIVWHDIKTESEPDYHLWHTREHMPERLGVPGFLRGRRGVDWNREKYRYLTLYEGESLETFGSSEYLHRLNKPTPWTLRIQPAFYNFVRSACGIAATVGRGVGGAMITIRVTFGDQGEAGFREIAPALADQLLALAGVNAVHVGTARPDITSVKTRETELRGMTRDNVFDGVIIVDGVGRSDLEQLMPRITELVEARGLKVDPTEVAVYDMAYCLEPSG